MLPYGILAAWEDVPTILYFTAALSTINAHKPDFQ
jgi:hypothetical protein